MWWLRHEYLPKRIMRQWDSRFTLSRRELDWLYAHGFLLYADIIGMVRSHKDRNYLSQIVFPYRKNAWYYDQEVIALQNLLLTHTVTVYLAHSAIEHHDTSPLCIPLYNTFKPLSTNDYITQIRTKHGPPDRTRKEKP